MLLFPKLFKIDYLISLNVTFNSDIGDIFFYYIKFYFYLSGKKSILKIFQKKKKIKKFWNIFYTNLFFIYYFILFVIILKIWLC